MVAVGLLLVLLALATVVAVYRHGQAQQPRREASRDKAARLLADDTQPVQVVNWGDR